MNNFEQKIKNIPQWMQTTVVSEYPLVKNIVNDIHAQGGVSYLVGGAVRDYFLEVSVKDLDIEVHKLPLATLEKILQKYGHVNHVGKAYGVLRLEHSDSDWSLPRTDASGRKPDVVVDPWMDVKQAFERRDLTMNAMGINMITGELVDPFRGLQDMKNKILRAPNPALFVEDPLRFYRVMQFVARFSMHPDAALNELCHSMDISQVSRERIETEFKKLLLQSKKPSQALVWLDAIGRLQEVLPELYATKGVIQELKWHPEGDVFEHTMQAFDAAAALTYESEHEKLVIMYAVLCHDLGKVVTTELKDGKIRSPGHAQAGVPLTKKLLRHIMNNKDIISAVCKLVEAHMYPGQFIAAHATLGAYKRLAYKLAPDVTLAMLAKVVLADRQGRNPVRGEPLTSGDPEVILFLEKATQAHVLTEVEKPILQGRDLMPEIQPGPEMGRLVKEAYALQLQEGIKDKEVLKEKVLKSQKSV